MKVLLLDSHDIVVPQQQRQQKQQQRLLQHRPQSFHSCHLLSISDHSATSQTSAASYLSIGSAVSREDNESEKTSARFAVVPKKSALKTKTRTRKRQAKSVSFSPSMDDDDDFAGVACTIFEIPHHSARKNQDIWWTNEEIDQARHEWQEMLWYLGRDDRCMNLVEHIVEESSSSTKVDRALEQLRAQYPEIRGFEVQLSTKYRDLVFFHGNTVLDAVDEVFQDDNLRHTNEGSALIRKASQASSRQVRKLARKFE